MLLSARRFTLSALGTLAAFVAGCSADASDSNSQRTSSGLANACTDGEERLADDGCNTCHCDDGAWSCTELACVGQDDGDAPGPCTDPPSSGSGSSGESSGSDAEDPHADVSNEDLPACVDGEAMTAEDGCNTCECVSGAWSCTELACGN